MNDADDFDPSTFLQTDIQESESAPVAPDVVDLDGDESPKEEPNKTESLEDDSKKSEEVAEVEKPPNEHPMEVDESKEDGDDGIQISNVLSGDGDIQTSNVESVEGDIQISNVISSNENSQQQPKDESTADAVVSENQNLTSEDTNNQQLFEASEADSSNVAAVASENEIVEDVIEPSSSVPFSEDIAKESSEIPEEVPSTNEEVSSSWGNEQPPAAETETPITAGDETPCQDAQPEKASEEAATNDEAFLEVRPNTNVQEYAPEIEAPTNEEASFQAETVPYKEDFQESTQLNGLVESSETPMDLDQS